MSKGAKLAVECFAENLQDYVNRQTEGEKYNLYTGLRVMAEEIQALSLSVGTIAHELNSISRKVDSLSRK
jgi:hypothetical protein